MSGPLRIVSYVRCSTVEQSVEGLSLEAQQRRIEAWCVASGAVVVETVVDAGVSGTVGLARREGGARIMELTSARRPTVDAVVITRLDRLTRNAAEALACLRTFSSGKVGLVSLADRLDLSTPQGRAMAQLSAVFAELERGLIAQRTSEALSMLRSTGRVYSPIPYGYTDRDGALDAVEAETVEIQQIRKLRDYGASFAAIAGDLNERGVPARRGGRWYPSTVRSVLLTSHKIANERNPSAAEGTTANAAPLRVRRADQMGDAHDVAGAALPGDLHQSRLREVHVPDR